MRILYSLLIALAAPFVVLRLLIKSRSNPDYRRHIYERFGYALPQAASNSLWFHAVSVGEFIALRPVLTALLQETDAPLWISCTTPTGRAQIAAFAKANPARIHYSYFPYDSPRIIKRFLKHIQPRAIIFMETELWPNLLYYAQRKNVQTLLINARLSAKSLRGYKKYASALITPSLAKLQVNAQSENDATRIAALGVPKANISVTPNMKYIIDSAAQTPLDDFFTPRHHEWLWIAASTHAPEERAMLQAQLTLLKTQADARLCLAPRHPERRDSLCEWIKEGGFTPKLRSKSEQIESAKDVLLLDTLGELARAYLSAEVVFIGGSLIAHGGQNPLQPLQAGCSLCFGPDMHNFQAISEQLLKREYVRQVQETSLAQTIATLHQARTKDTRARIQADLQRYSATTLAQHVAYLKSKFLHIRD